MARASVSYYRSCCRAVARFCRDRGGERLTEQAVDEFLAVIDGRWGNGEISSSFRSNLEKSAGMMLEFQESGAVDWKRRRPRSVLSGSVSEVLEGFAGSVTHDLAPNSARLVTGEARQFLGYLQRLHRPVEAVALDDVRGYLIDARLRHTSDMGNTVWSIKRFFRFLNAGNLTVVQVEETLARVGPRRVRALPAFTREETKLLVAAIDTATPLGKRDYAMIQLALSTGLRCGDIVLLRLDQIDWRRDEIRLVQHKTSAALTLPLTAEAGNAIASWVLEGRPSCDAPEVFVRLYAPFTWLTGPTGALVMKRWLGRAGVTHEPGDGKTFHALRRTVGTRLVESGAELALTAQILGHASVNSSRRYIALADECLRQCSLPLDGLVPIAEGSGR